MEKDHLPPRNLFEKPRPSNLITCPICERCHRPTHKDDEFFRVFVSSFMTRNKSGRRLWENKVVPRTLQRGRIRPLIDPMVKTAEPVAIQTSVGEFRAMKFSTDRKPIDRVLTRITRGLHSIVSPGVESKDFSLVIDLVDPFHLSERMELAQRHCHHFSRGDGVYDCWWGLLDTDARHGLWVHMFFHSVAFVVRH